MGDLKNVQLTDLDLDVKEIDSNIDVAGGGSGQIITASINYCTTPVNASNVASCWSCGGNQCSESTIACNATGDCYTACSGCQSMGPCH